MQRFWSSAQRAIASGVLMGIVLSGVVMTSANARVPAPCAGRVLILTAMPLELNPIIAKTTVHRQRVVQPPGIRSGCRASRSSSPCTASSQVTTRRP